MSLQGRIVELSNRHRELEHKIDQEQKRPAADSAMLRELKRQKLRIKEELKSLESS